MTVQSVEPIPPLETGTPAASAPSVSQTSAPDAGSATVSPLPGVKELPPLPEVKPPSQFNRIASLLSLGPKRILLRLYDQAMRKLSGTPVWKYSRITPHLYVGGQHLSLKGMDLEGITAIVNMREDYHSDEKRGIGGKRHLHLATRDNTPPSLEALDQGADFIHQEINTGGKVYIHCGVGIGRAPSMAAAYLIKYENLGAADAIALIRKTRSFIHLTSKQYKQLEVFAEATRKAKQQAGQSTAQKPISAEAKENIVITQ